MFWFRAAWCGGQADPDRRRGRRSGRRLRHHDEIAREKQLEAPPLAGGVQRLADRFGRARAMRLVLLSETIRATEALDLGIATHMASDNELEKVTDDLVQQRATGPTLAYEKMRALLRAWSSGGVSAADVINAQLAAGIGDTKDFAEAMIVVAAALAVGEP